MEKVSKIAHLINLKKTPHSNHENQELKQERE